MSLGLFYKNTQFDYFISPQISMHLFANFSTWVPESSGSKGGVDRSALSPFDISVIIILYYIFAFLTMIMRVKNEVIKTKIIIDILLHTKIALPFEDFQISTVVSDTSIVAIYYSVFLYLCCLCLTDNTYTITHRFTKKNEYLYKRIYTEF